MEKYINNDFNLRLPNNNSILNAKKKEITWTGYRCNTCGSSGTRPGTLLFPRCPFCGSANIEKSDSNTNKKFWKPVEQSKCELEGPYECPWCGGHIMLDTTYLDQVSLMAKCPYCSKYVYARKV